MNAYKRPNWPPHCAPLPPGPTLALWSPPQPLPPLFTPLCWPLKDRQLLCLIVQRAAGQKAKAEWPQASSGPVAQLPAWAAPPAAQQGPGSPTPARPACWKARPPRRPAVSTSSISRHSPPPSSAASLHLHHQPPFSTSIISCLSPPPSSAAWLRPSWCWMSGGHRRWPRCWFLPLSLVR